MPGGHHGRRRTKGVADARSGYQSRGQEGAIPSQQRQRAANTGSAAGHRRGYGPSDTKRECVCVRGRERNALNADTPKEWPRGLQPHQPTVRNSVSVRRWRHLSSFPAVERVKSSFTLPQGRDHTHKPRCNQNQNTKVSPLQVLVYVCVPIAAFLKPHRAQTPSLLILVPTNRPRGESSGPPLFWLNPPLIDYLD